MAIAPLTGRIGEQRFDAKEWGRAATLDHVRQGHTTLMMGHGGESVAQLQQRLVELGLLDKSDVDGRFGAKTRDALARFQKQSGLDADGVLGEKTYAGLFAAPAVAPTGTPRTSDAYRERVRDAAEARRFSGDVERDPWKETTANTLAAREERARAGLERLERVERSLDSLPADRREAARRTIDNLRRLYSDLSGRYATGSGAHDDVDRAQALEERLARQIGAR